MASDKKDNDWNPDRVFIPPSSLFSRTSVYIKSDDKDWDPDRVFVPPSIRRGD